MPVYKVSEGILDCVEQGRPSFSGIIFDCDGVLIDASRSYDLTVEVCTKAFAASLGAKLSDKDQLYRTLELLRNLGTFNNDWESVTVIVGFLFARTNPKRNDKKTPLKSRIRELESDYLRSGEKDDGGSFLLSLGLEELIRFLESCETGVSREEIIYALIPDREKRVSFYNFVSYPLPVGEGLLSTFFDEAMYGKKVFRETYGMECVTSSVSDPGNIENESVIVRSEALEDLQKLCEKNLGIITGRPRVPTAHTLGQVFADYFQRPDLCVFTGENLLNTEEVKPSPKPLLRVLEALQTRESSSVLYVGDSEEDLLMVVRANQSRLPHDPRVMFAAIAPTKERAEFFDQRGGENVDCIVSDVNELPKALRGKMSWTESASKEG